MKTSIRFIFILLSSSLAARSVTGSSATVGPYTLNAFSSAQPLSNTNCNNGGWLVEVKNAELNEAVKAVSSGGRDSWIGARYDDTDAKWKWNSHEPLTYTNWDTGEPQSLLTRKCAVMKTNGKWSSVGCSSTQRPYVCQTVLGNHIKYGTTLFERVDGRKAWTEKDCKEKKAWLATMTNSSLDYTAFDIIRTKGTNDKYWIGLTYGGTSTGWVWNSSIPLNYTRWGTSPEGGTSTCASVPKDGFWRVEGCPAVLSGSICQSEPCKYAPCSWNVQYCEVTLTSPYYKCVNPCQPNPCNERSGGRCRFTQSHPHYECSYPCDPHPCNTGTCRVTGFDAYECACDYLYHGSICQHPNFVDAQNCKYYASYNQAKTFTEANSACSGLSSGGSLAMDKSPEIHSSISDLLNLVYGSGQNIYLWIGGRKEPAWEWIDSLPLTSNGQHNNWASGRPDGSGQCVAARKLNTGNFSWTDRDCGNTLSYICELPSQDPCNSAQCVHGYCVSKGCQKRCICNAGYFGSRCYMDLILLTTETSTVSIIGAQSLTIRVTVTSYDTASVIVEVFGPHNRSVPLDSKTTSQNGTVDLELGTLYPSDEGVYIVYAFPTSHLYNTSLQLVAEVRVKPSVRLSTASASSPVTTGPENITCIGDGYPSPDVTWSFGGKPVPLDGSGVHQEIKDQTAVLYIKSAQLNEEGVYLCIANNTVGDGETAEDRENFALSVYGPPTIEAFSVKNCSEVGSVDITWAPHRQSTLLMHKFIVTDKTRGNVVKNLDVQPTKKIITIGGLSALTEYIIKVEVCPDECISSLSDSIDIRTGDGLPSSVLGAQVSQNDTDENCTITWELPEALWTDFVAEFQISIESTYLVELIGGQQIWTQNHTTPFNQTNFTLSTRANRDYSLFITPRACAGYGPTTKINGTCIRDTEAPEKIKSPLIDTEYLGSTRRINLEKLDESNGPISCVFIILKMGEEGIAFGNGFNTEDLYSAQQNAISDSLNEDPGYIALAIPRSGILSDYNEIGDGRNTSCDWKQSTHKRRSTERTNSSTYRGMNRPLKPEEKYSCYVVTSTPTRSGGVILKQSKVQIFENSERDSEAVVGEESFTWIAAVAACTVLLLLSLSVTLYIRNRMRSKGYSTDSVLPPMLVREPSKTYLKKVKHKARSDTDIPMTGLKDFYESMTANAGEKLSEQFLALKEESKSRMLGTSFAFSSNMKRKNRYRDILPYDNVRVRLSGNGEETYINASYIHGFSQQKKFIASQGPLPNTNGDFWRMVVEQRCKVIVMLTRCEEKGKVKCEKYWPDVTEIEKYGTITVNNLEEVKYGGFTKRSLKLISLDEDDIIVEQFHFTSWPDHGVPVCTSSFFRLHRAVMESQKEHGGRAPILAHCSAGVGRTGTFIGFDNLLVESQDLRHIDVFNCVLAMREQRMDMVQNKSQYEFLHKLILENYAFGDTDVDAEEIKKDSDGGEKPERCIAEFKNLSLLESETSDRGDEEQSDLIPEHSRVAILRTTDDTEIATINAAHTETYNDNYKIITGQTPSPADIPVFWRAVVDHKVDLIVMLNDTTEGEDTYWPDKESGRLTVNDVTINAGNEKEMDGVIKRNLSVTRANQSMDVTQYQVTNWETLSEKNDVSSALALVKLLLDDALANQETIALVHCSDGIGRTGVICAVLNAIERLKVESKLDLFRTIKDLRDWKPGMLPNEEYYRFCYKVIVEYLNTTNLYSTVELKVDQAAQTVVYQNLSI